jgi:hypothetical protein
VRAVAITRIVLPRLLSTPGGVLGALALLSTLPLLLVLAPTGISSRNTTPAALSYELAFIGQAAGVVMGLAALERIAPALAREPAGARLAWESIALVASGLVGAGLPLLSGILCAASPVLGAAGIQVVGILPPLATEVAAGTMIARLCPTPGVAPWLCASGILLAPMILPRSVSSSSFVVMTAGFLAAAWLLNHIPIGGGGGGGAGGASGARTGREAR